MNILIGIVGPCKSGKSVLKEGLEQKGYNARHIAQEHSFSPTMWKKIANPDILIFLDVNYKNTILRGINWTEKEYKIQLERLTNARTNADITIDTNQIDAEEVLDQTLRFLDSIA